MSSGEAFQTGYGQSREGQCRFIKNSRF